MPKLVWKPTEFMRLILKYEKDPSKLAEIKEKLGSTMRPHYLYKLDNFLLNPIGMAVKRNLKIKMTLLESIDQADIGVEINNLLFAAISTNDYETVRILFDKFSDILDLYENENRSSIFIQAFQTGNPMIIKLFLDFYAKYDIFTMCCQKRETVYTGIFTELNENHQDIVLKLLMEHEYYGVIIINQTVRNFRVLSKILPALNGEKPMKVQSMYINTRTWDNSYAKSKNLAGFRKNVLRKIEQKRLEIMLQPDSMEAIKAKYSTTFLLKFGTNRLSEMTIEQKNEAYEIITGDPNGNNFCRFYSVLSTDDLGRLF